jgi:hypothetical protein
MDAERASAAEQVDERARTDAARPPAVWVRAVLLALAGLGLSTFALTVAGRIAFPWPLEWMEGASLQHALRLLAGEPLYAPPSAAFIPYLYPPLAYLPVAGAAALLGPSLPVARAVSLAASLAAMLFVGRAAQRASGHAAAGWAAAGLFAIGFGYGGAFLDLVRVDAVFVMLIAASAERLLAGRTGAALACLVLSAFAKQHGVVLLGALSLALLARAPRRSIKAVALSWTALLAAFLALELATSGWFGRYTFVLPRSHRVEVPLFFSFFAVDLLVYLPVLVLAASAGLLRGARRVDPFTALVLAGAVVGALGRAHPGGHDNVRLPAFALLCIAGVAPLCRAALGARTRVTAAALCAALALQFAVLWQPPAVHGPMPGSARAFAEVRAALERCAAGGRAVALDHPLLAGAPFVHTMALSDLRMAEGSALAAAGTAALLDALRAGDAPAAVLAGETFPALAHVLAERYRLCAELPAPRLASGYTPGVRGPSGSVQRVYARLPDE